MSCAEFGGATKFEGNQSDYNENQFPESTKAKLRSRRHIPPRAKPIQPAKPPVAVKIPAAPIKQEAKPTATSIWLIKASSQPLFVSIQT
ncbi:unnamed protein product [Anisakis simplex]|uniref:Uncharacterized protein n=1 Tax=Anisakis simplex TaxID=6269 RepID=A0A0M3K9G5_ANISI|nr:unnamed protein product [Anisakis simplex]